MVADGKIYVGDVPGGWRILQADRNGCKLLSEQSFIDDRGAPDEVFATPAIAHGRVILSTMNNTYCISEKPADYRSPTRAVVFGPSHPLDAGEETASIQVEPAETVLAPGQSLQFKVRGFDAKGNPTGPVEADFSVANLEGQMHADGRFTAAGDRIQAGHIQVTRGELKGSARVRIVPSLPYEENFDDLPVGQAPPGWMTSRVKSHVDEIDGQKVLRKLADRPSPPFARLRCYIMPPVEAGYTMRCDMLGVSKNRRFLPDMGLINARYLMILTGTTERTRKLRLVAWSPVPRLIREVEYPWKGDTWYRTVFSVQVDDGKSLVRAKVWPRDEQEPSDWTLTMEDPCPHEAGSPGLYAYSVAITEKSKGTEVLFDNVRIEQ